MRKMDMILEIVRKHPEGIPTIRIAEIVYGGEGTDFRTKISQTSTKCRSLEKYGLIACVMEEVPNRKRWPQTQAVWRPL